MEDWSPFNAKLACGIDVGFGILCAQSEKGFGTITRVEQMGHKNTSRFTGK
jgi:hypothetical protein